MNFAFPTNSVGDIIYGNLGEYFTDPGKRNCFVEMWVERLNYNADQYPGDIMVQPLEWQPTEPEKIQHRKMWTNNLYYCLFQWIKYLLTEYWKCAND